MPHKGKWAPPVKSTGYTPARRNGLIDLLLRECRLPDGEAPVHIAIAEGRIAAVGREAPAAREVIEVEGRLVTPGLVDAHIHLDKALLHDRVSATAGTAAEAIRLTREAKRSLTVEDIPPPG